MSIGMSYEEFWYKDVQLVEYYRKAHELKTRRDNEMMWMQGIYVLEALNSTVGNMFAKKGSKLNEYPKAPYPVTEQEAEARKASEELLKQERMKAAFANFASSLARKKMS